MIADVAVLFVDPRGPYPDLVVHWYDKDRDARTYSGTLPVVAHPACGPWGRLSHMCRLQDAGDALAAVDIVRRVGGVLEHPADSRLWQVKGMPRPGALPDAWGGRTLSVEQWWWGHRAIKPTWVYVVGASHIPPIPKPDGPRPLGGNAKRKRGDPRRSMLERLPKTQRHLTPHLFAEWLLAIAANCSAPTKETP